MNEKKPLEQRIFLLLLNEVKAHIPKIITFFILLFVYSYIWEKYGFERVVLIGMILILIRMGGKK